MAKHKSFRDDPKYVRIENKWQAAYRRRDRAYDAYIHPRVSNLNDLRVKRAAVDAAERAVKTWRTELDRRRVELIKLWRAEGTL